MKQKIIFIVLIAAGIYLPVGSKECGKACMSAEAIKKVQVKELPVTTVEEVSSYPASPISRSFLNL